MKTEKRCSRCQKVKSASEYSKRRNNSAGREYLASRCKACENDLVKKRRCQYIASGRCVRCVNPAAEGKTYCASCLESETARSIRAARRLKRQAVEYKGGECIDCHLCTDVLSVYDFHHLDSSTKEFSLRDKGITVLDDEIKQELDKCVLVCANCHRTRHWTEVTYSPN